MEQNLAVEERKQRGNGPARRLRQAGKIPAVMYGQGGNHAIAVDPKIVEKLLLTEGGKNSVLTVQGAGLDGKKALVKDYQVDPRTRRLLHVDLMEIDVTEKVEVTVKLTFIGKSVGVVEGGVLNVIAREIDVKCFPDKIPSHIDVDVTPLNIGESFHLDDLTLPEGLEKASHQNPTIITVVPPAKEEEMQASLAPGAEPEVLTEKKEEAPAEAKDEKKDK
ncbi:MAG: 50S ribosomal protein L25 [Bdellovibrionaceae bacterium]|nr:50S ribosomal protein L25 [Bdellovibrionales bacterium]MCB9254530.1 50S ribosomal protein L25 [Pseudobdellovibrionaceae bacterium]